MDFALLFFVVGLAFLSLAVGIIDFLPAWHRKRRRADASRARNSAVSDAAAAGPAIIAAPRPGHIATFTRRTRPSAASATAGSHDERCRRLRANPRKGPMSGQDCERCGQRKGRLFLFQGLKLFVDFLSFLVHASGYKGCLRICLDDAVIIRRTFTSGRGCTLSWFASCDAPPLGARGAHQF